MAITLVEIAERLPFAKSYGHYYMGLCPYHSDRRPSLMVSSKQYKCKSCGAHGSLADLYKTLNPSDPRLRMKAPKRFGNRIFPEYSDLNGIATVLNRAHDNLVLDNGTKMVGLRKRGLFGDSVLNFSLGYLDNWYTIPIYNKHENIIGGVARASDALVAEGTEKYDTPYGQPPMLYIPNWTLWRNSDKVFVTFGIFDAISLASLGFAACSPTTGQDSTNPEWLDKVRKTIYVIPDKNETSAAINLARSLGFRGRVLSLPYEYYGGLNDPSDFLATQHTDELTEFIRRETDRG